MNAKNNYRINIRMSEAEFIAANMRANELGISSSALIRLLLRLPIKIEQDLAQSFANHCDKRTYHKLLNEISDLHLDSSFKNNDSEVVTFTNKDIFRLKKELTRIGQNLNQNTRALNRLNKFISQCVLLDSEDKEKMHHTIDEIYAESSKLTDNLRPLISKLNAIIAKPSTAILVENTGITLKTESKGGNKCPT